MAQDAETDHEFLHLPASPAAALANLAAPVQTWFRQQFPEPTLAQRLAWPALAAGKTLLLCSPTGSGKTLAAFLPILNHLGEEPSAGSVRCLYVAPLKALINDTYKTLKRAIRSRQNVLTSSSVS